MKNIICLFFLILAYQMSAQNPFEIQAAKNADELQKIVFDEKFKEIYNQNIEIFGKDDGFEQTKFQYLYRSLQDNNIQNYLFEEILKLQECCKKNEKDVGIQLSPEKNSWEKMIEELNTFTSAKFNISYSEAELVEIANSNFAPPDLPEWLKSAAGTKADKVKYYTSTYKN